MSRLDPDVIAFAILTAPGWARVGITAPTESIRKDAAQELARAILTGSEATLAAVREDQFELTL